MILTENDVHQSRWGFHPISYETFRKLKILYKRYWETEYAIARWKRWNRKLVHRHGPEPKYCPLFAEKYKSEVNPMSRGVYNSFHQARMPQASPEDVKPLELSVDEIDRLYESVEDWFAK